MDSIGEQIKSMMPDAETIAAAHKRLEDDTAFKMFIEKYPDIDAETLNINRIRLLNMSREYKNCAVCCSLESCKNDFPQHQYALGVHQEGERWIITEHVRPCRKFGGQAHAKK